MSISAGSRIGLYEVVGPLGAGGMGEVYRARDTQLPRSVAIKILPEAFAADEHRRTQLAREAHVLASLNHPNIATLYGIETSPDGYALVMELVEGETLADRLTLRRGSRPGLPMREALVIADQIAAALEAAHAHGIIHHDLKPSNVAVRSDGTVKVLDFGLAKQTEDAVDHVNAGVTTRSLDDVIGIIGGTPAYLSPEQARGLRTDKRADIWAFGCVLYEILTGRRPFTGEGAELIAQILERPVNLDLLPAETPSTIRRLLRRCLEKDPQERLRDIGDARLEIADVLADVTDGPASRATRSLWPGSWIASGLVAAVLAGAAIGMLADRSAPTGPSSPLYMSMPFDGRPASYPFGTRQIAISSDGSIVAFDSNRGLQIRRNDQKEAVVISSGGRNPFFSADGDWVGFFNDTAMVKVRVRGGTPVNITGLTDRPFGAAWRADGTIVFATTEGLFEVSANGGEPNLIVRPDRVRGETLYAWPHFLPDGGSILYTVLFKDSNEGPQTILLDLKSHERKALVQGSSAVYAASGHLLYFLGSTLNAIPFDVATGALTGKPVQIPGVSVASFTDNGAANFAISDTGTLIFLPPAPPARGTFEWIDRRGKREPLDIEPQRYGYAMVSPDGTRAAVERWMNGHRNIWILDLRRLTQTQLTDGPTEDMLPAWSADGQRVFFASNRSGNFDVYSQPADGASSAKLEFGGPEFQASQSATPDGTRLIVYDRFKDLAVLDLAKPNHLEPLLHSKFDERLGQVSPDGKWIAYESNESGNQFEIVLRSFPDVNRRREILSINGGRYPRWGPKDLHELYYLSTDGAIMAVPITLSPALVLGTPKKLFDWQKPIRGRSGLLYDVAPDGRFLMPKAEAPAPDGPTNVSLIYNWLPELRRREP